MTGDNTKNMRLVALFLLGWSLFNFPILSLVNRLRMVWGIPLLYLYLFLVWSLIILLTLLITRTGSKGRRIENADKDVS